MTTTEEMIKEGLRKLLKDYIKYEAPYRKQDAICSYCKAKATGQGPQTIKHEISCPFSLIEDEEIK